MRFVNAKIPNAYAEGLNWYAAKNGLTRSAALRRAIVTLIMDAKPPNRIREPVAKELQRGFAGG
jgi:hypothetical protein